MMSDKGAFSLELHTILHKLKDHKPTLFDENMRKYSILIPLIEIDGETHLLFEIRSMQLHSQPGDICFPGGRVEPTDRDEMHSAIRETAEELCIDEPEVQDVLPLDIMYPSSTRLIYTYVGHLQNESTIHPNEEEVEEIFTVPLQFFLDTNPDVYKVTFEATPEKDFPFHLIVGGENYDWRNGKIDQYFYQYEDKVIWGLTAKIILNFLSVIKQD